MSTLAALNFADKLIGVADLYAAHDVIYIGFVREPTKDEFEEMNNQHCIFFDENNDSYGVYC
jgi:hypothetical protein